jgi:hypothetical protein
MPNPRSYTSIFRTSVRYSWAGLAGILVAAVFLDATLRLIGYGSIPTLGYGRYQTNITVPELGYAGRPNIDGIQTQEGYSHPVLNDLGFHDIPHRVERDSNSFRVAVLGNSFTMAIQVETPETYVSILGKELRECAALDDKRIEALNFGVGGYTTTQNYLLMRDFVWRYSPDIIVLQESPGMPDPEEDVSARVTIEDDGRQNVDLSFMNTRTYKMRSSKAFTWFLKITDHSRLLQYMNEFRRKLTARSRKSMMELAAESSSGSSQQKARLLKAISDISKSHSTPIAIFLIPDGEEMDPRNENKPVLSKDEIWWEEQARNLSIPIINPATDAWNFAHKNRIFLSGFGSQSGGGHLTRYGNAFFGQELASAICSMLRH